MASHKSLIVVLETQSSIAKSLQLKEEKFTWVMEDGKHKITQRNLPQDPRDFGAQYFLLNSMTEPIGEPIPVLEPRWTPTPYRDPFTLTLLQTPIRVQHY